MSKVRSVVACIVAASVMIVLPTAGALAAEGAHPHHVAVAFGASRHDGKNSEFWGVDYSYTFQNNVYLLGFYEQVRGDFNISAVGVQVGKKFGHGFKIAIGPGVENKLKKNKNLALIRTTVGYDWHKGNWSFGPALSYDLIEDASNTAYVGFAVGFGF